VLAERRLVGAVSLPREGSSEPPSSEERPSRGSNSDSQAEATVGVTGGNARSVSTAPTASRVQLGPLQVVAKHPEGDLGSRCGAENL
jgi:hypothetical protein